MWRYFVFLGYVGKWMFASYYLEAMTRPVSVCVWGGGGIRQAVSGPFLSRGAFCQPHSFSLPADTSLQEPLRIRLHQSVPIMPLINLFLSPTYPNIYRKNLCQINWFAPFFKFYKPPLCGGILNLIVLNTYLSFPSLFLLNSNKHMPWQRWEGETENLPL